MTPARVTLKVLVKNFHNQNTAGSIFRNYLKNFGSANFLMISFLLIILIPPVMGKSLLITGIQRQLCHLNSSNGIDGKGSVTLVLKFGKLKKIENKIRSRAPSSPDTGSEVGSNKWEMLDVL